MSTILGIEVASDLNTLSSEDLAALVEALRTAARTAVAGDVDLAGLAEIRSAKTAIDEIKAVLSGRAEAEAALADEVAGLIDELTDDEAAATTVDEVEEVDEEIEEETDAEKVPAAAVSVVASAWTPVRRSAAAVSAQTPTENKVALSPTTVPIKAVSGVSGYNAGDEFASMTALAEALTSRWQDIAGGGTEKMTVGRIDGRFPDSVRLGDNRDANIEKLGGLDITQPAALASITAAMCAPAEPYYGLVQMSSTERPVRGSLSTYVPQRGAVTIYPSPKLADITAGMGLWTRADDANSSATKAACATIACATPVQYDIYGIYRCMTIKNLLQMTFPELVEAYLNRLAALQARLAEVTLLDAMTGSVNAKTVTVAAPSPKQGSSVNLWATLIQVLAVYREQERYGDQNLDMWAPRWMRESLRMDIVRQRNTVGLSPAARVPAGTDVDTALSRIGVNVTWTMDNATAWTSTIGTQNTASALVAMPTSVKFILAPKGNFRLLDRGDLQIGVTNNNLYRDNVSNTKNQFTLFYESFEGLMDFGATSWDVSVAGFDSTGEQVGDIAAV